GDCRLCLRKAELVESHIVPAFVFRWIKRTSATGFLRFSETPNHRLQDGMKRRWMCRGCEGNLARLEKRFAEQLFSPIADARPAPYRYGSWLAPCLASIAWRALLYVTEQPSNEMSADERALIPACQERWRACAAGEAGDAGPHELHFIPLGLASLANP